MILATLASSPRFFKCLSALLLAVAHCGCYSLPPATDGRQPLQDIIVHDNIYRPTDLQDDREFSWRLWITGTKQVIALRLRNFTPSVCTLEGGVDQVIRIRGGERFAVRRRVVRNPGECSLLARPYQEEAKLEAQIISSEVAPRLDRLQHQFHARIHSESPRELLSILEWFETRTQEILGYRELAALRDHVKDQFDKGFKEVESLPHFWLFRPLSASSEDPELSLAAYTKQKKDLLSLWEVVPDVMKSTVRHIWDLAKRNDLVLDLCVKSTPDEAEFIIYPASDRTSPRQLRTDELMPNVYRGLYSYEVNRADFGLLPRNTWYKPVTCHVGGEEVQCQLDLVLDPRPTLKCTLRTSDEPEVSICRRTEGDIEGCES